MAAYSQETLLEKQVRESFSKELEKQRQLNNIPKTENELKFALINMKIPEVQQSEMEKSLETVKKNLKLYIDPLVKNNMLPVDNQMRDLNKTAASADYVGFMNCLDQFALNPDIKKSKELINLVPIM